MCGLGRCVVRILIIEDEPKVVRTLVKGLEADHFAVDVATDGEEGLQLATEIDYDALILDWNLPKLDGLTAAEETAQVRVAGADLLPERPQGSVRPDHGPAGRRR